MSTAFTTQGSNPTQATQNRSSIQASWMPTNYTPAQVSTYNSQNIPLLSANNSAPITQGLIQKIPSQGSVVDYLNSQGKASDYGSRAQMAQQYGISNYQGTADQNTQLLNMLKNGQQPQQNTQLTGTTVNQVGSPQQSNLGILGGTTAQQQQQSMPSGTITQQNPQKIDTSTYSGMINSLANQNVNYNPDYQNQLKAYQDAVNAKQQFESNLADVYAANASNPIPLEFQQGRAQIIQQQNALKEAALQNAINQQQTSLGITQTSQQLAQGALGTAAGLIPEAMRYGGSYGTGPAAASNVKSVQDLTTQNNNMQAMANGADANMQLAINTAKIGGFLDMNVPYLNTLQQKLGTNFESNPAVINFKTALNTVRSMYATILGGGEATDLSRGQAMQAIPDNISLGALQALQNQLKAEVQNRVAGNNQQISQISGGQTNQNTQTNTQSQANSGSNMVKTDTGSIVFENGKWVVKK